MRLIFALLLCAATSVCFSQSNIDPRQQVASIGDLKLETGAVINDCHIGYRAYGKLNSDKSNAVLFPTWFGGTTKNLEGMAPWQAVDTTRFYLILADALGNGVSSSPSNSISQHGINFPRFSICDMVTSEHELCTKKLGITHLYAVMGISMGGIQTFQWAVSYPDFMSRLIPIVGSPQPTGYDLMLYHTLLNIIEGDSSFNHGNYTQNPNIVTFNMLLNLSLTTPGDRAASIPNEKFPQWMQSIKTQQNNDWNNTRYQLLAIIGNDISKPFHNSLKEAAAHVKAAMLVISSAQDHVVNPAPAIQFAKMLPAKLIVIDSPMGHIAPNFSMPEIKNSITAFLAN